jgi:hypothetical protein
MIGSDDVLACFIAGNVFTWDDWFRLETMDDSLQPTIDMLLNLSIFLYFGAICPWASFLHNDYIPIYRLIPLGILILLLRRLPVVFALHKWIHQIEERRQAIFVGFFGPIGVSAIFYLYVSIEFLDTVTNEGVIRTDAQNLAGTMTVVVWFLTICSIVVHGLSIPLGKLGFYLPRTLSHALDSTSRDEPQPFRVSGSSSTLRGVLRDRRGRRSASNAPSGATTPTERSSEPQLYRIGGTIIRSPAENVGSGSASGEDLAQPALLNRTIRFPDDDGAN